VDVHFTGVDRLTEDGVVGSDGVERKVDTVHCASGMSSTLHPLSKTWYITNLNKLSMPPSAQLSILLEKRSRPLCQMGQGTECYMGLTIPGFPNLITFNGPTWPITNGFCLGSLDAMGDYAIQMIQTYSWCQPYTLSNPARAPRCFSTSMFSSG
jgi:hypothetical protein